MKHVLNEQVSETGPEPVFILFGDHFMRCYWAVEQKVIKKSMPCGGKQGLLQFTNFSTK